MKAASRVLTRGSDGAGRGRRAVASALLSAQGEAQRHAATNTGCVQVAWRSSWWAIAAEAVFGLR